MKLSVTFISYEDINIFHTFDQKRVMAFKLNRIKEVLEEQRRTQQWLAQQLGKNKTTVYNWCNNHNQPTLQGMHRIANMLGVDILDLIESSTRNVNQEAEV